MLTRNRYLKIHIGIVTEESPFTKLCLKKFTICSSVKIHRIMHTGERTYKCDLCKKALFVTTNLNKDKVIHTGEKPFKCKVCQKVFYWANCF